MPTGQVGENGKVESQMFKLLYSVNGDIKKELKSDSQFDAILFLSGTLPYPEFNSIACFASMKNEIVLGPPNGRASRSWVDGDKSQHIVFMEIEK